MRKKNSDNQSARPKAARVSLAGGGSGGTAAPGSSPAEDSGAVRDALEVLLRGMTAGWPRRGHNLLEFFCSDGYFLEMLWQSGFDVSGQEQDPRFLALARERMKNAAEFTQANYESLPYDDRSFDYVVCLNGLALAERPAELVNEMFRLATRGVLLAFPCGWSIHGLGSVCKRRRGERRFFSPLEISRLITEADGSGYGASAWAGSLWGAAWSWKIKRLARFNFMSLPLPMGAVSMVRVDFNPPLGSPRVLVAGKRRLRQETAASGVSRG